ncbi:hypothetical protein M011DRAFT_471939, partial [Sporormia fimetaria CBS 119925]
MPAPLPTLPISNLPTELHLTPSGASRKPQIALETDCRLKLLNQYKCNPVLVWDEKAKRTRAKEVVCETVERFF